MKASTEAKKALYRAGIEDEDEAKEFLKERHKRHIEGGVLMGGELIQDLQMYYPEDYDKAIPKEGCWIMVLDTHSFGISSEVGKKEEATGTIWVKALSFFFAKPVVKNFDYEWNAGQKMAKITTKQGDVLLYPHEYNVVDDIYKYYESFGDGVNIVWLNDKAGKDVADPDKLFYIRQRGIGIKEAYKMILGDIKDPNLLYLECDDELLEHFNKQVPPKQETELKTESQTEK